MGGHALLVCWSDSQRRVVVDVPAHRSAAVLATRVRVVVDSPQACASAAQSSGSVTFAGPDGKTGPIEPCGNVPLTTAFT